MPLWPPPRPPAPMSDPAEILNRIVAEDARYSLEAYVFVNESLRHLQDGLEERRHVTGRELLEGIRIYALEQFGPLSREVFSCWGVTRCEDFGEIVFNLVDGQLLGKTEEDRREDFGGGYDFRAVFEAPFLGRGEEE